MIDREVSRLLREAQQRATDLLVGHSDALDRLVALLQDKETLDGREVYEIVGSRLPLVPIRNGAGHRGAA